MSLFIVFEGIDGSGQTTQSNLLADFLKSKGRDVVLTKEPTDEGVGRRIRAVLQKRVQSAPLELQRMFVEDRRRHLDMLIKPALESGKAVITDRYFLSTLAYGGIDVEIDKLRDMNSAFRIPDITFVIDVPPEVALGRVQKRLAGSGKSKNETELFEELEKLKRVRENYLKIAKLYPNVHVINGDRPIEAVAAEVQKIVLSILNRERV